MDTNEINASGQWKKNIVVCVILICLAIVSATVGTRYASSQKTHQKTIAVLDEKKTDVLELATASTLAATAAAAVPGDATDPIANKLADISSYLLIALCAIFLEKYLLTILGYMVFRYIIPIGLILIAVTVFWNYERLRKIGIKLLIIGLLVYIAIPTSTKVSVMIDETYESSVQAAIDAAEREDAKLKETPREEKDTKEVEKKEEKGIWDRIKESISEAKEEISNAASNVTGFAKDMAQELKETLNHFIEATAIMIITSCVIPILVMLFFVWLIKIVVGVEIDLSFAHKRIKNTIYKGKKKEKRDLTIR